MGNGEPCISAFFCSVLYSLLAFLAKNLLEESKLKKNIEIRGVLLIPPLDHILMIINLTNLRIRDRNKIDTLLKFENTCSILGGHGFSLSCKIKARYIVIPSQPQPQDPKWLYLRPLCGKNVFCPL